MVTHAMTLTLPENVFQRLQRVAHIMHKPLETVVSQSLEGNLPPLIEDVPDEWRNEMAEMEQFPDGALWKVSKEPLPESQWARHQELLERNQNGILSESERQELEHLRKLSYPLASYEKNPLTKLPNPLMLEKNDNVYSCRKT